MHGVVQGEHHCLTPCLLTLPSQVYRLCFVSAPTASAMCFLYVKPGVVTQGTAALLAQSNAVDAKPFQTVSPAT